VKKISYLKGKNIQSRERGKGRKGVYGDKSTNFAMGRTSRKPLAEVEGGRGGGCWKRRKVFQQRGMCGALRPCQSHGVHGREKGEKVPCQVKRIKLSQWSQRLEKIYQSQKGTGAEGRDAPLCKPVSLTMKRKGKGGNCGREMHLEKTTLY